MYNVDIHLINNLLINLSANNYLFCNPPKITRNIDTIAIRKIVTAKT